MLCLNWLMAKLSRTWFIGISLEQKNSYFFLFVLYPFLFSRNDSNASLFCSILSWKLYGLFFGAHLITKACRAGSQTENGEECGVPDTHMLPTRAALNSRHSKGGSGGGSSGKKQNNVCFPIPSLLNTHCCIVSIRIFSEAPARKKRRKKNVW